MTDMSSPPPKLDTPRTRVEGFNTRRWAVHEAMEILAKFQPADMPVSPYVVVFVAQYLETGRMPAAEDEEVDRSPGAATQTEIDQMINAKLRNEMNKAAFRRD